MPSQIKDTCTACKLCGDICPTNSIHPGEKYLIDSDTCEDCLVCIKICPVNAIVNKTKDKKSTT